MNKELEVKILRLASQICFMHGNVAGDRCCQDWGAYRQDRDSTENIDALTGEEKQFLNKQFEDYNSDGRDYDPNHTGFHDEMCVSFMIGEALKKLAESK